MASGQGHFDDQGNVCLKLHLCGVAHPEPGLEFNGILDTGFTGFIQLPMQHAFSLKLPLEGTATYTLADGSSATCLTALARTEFAGKSHVGLVTLASGSKDILVGMSFLRQFELGVIIFAGNVYFLDEEAAQGIVDDEEAAAAAIEDAAVSAAEGLENSNEK